MQSRCEFELCRSNDRSFAVIDKDNTQRYCSRMHLVLGQLSIISLEITRSAKSTTKQAVKMSYLMAKKAALALEKEWKDAA